MGEVYLAEHTAQSREVALKILPQHFLDDGQRVQRFRQEARAVLALNHPNVVTVYDIGETEGVHFISTEFVEGQTLRERMRNVRLTIEEAVDIALQVASAFAYAPTPKIGFVHPDQKGSYGTFKGVKPSGMTGETCGALVIDGPSSAFGETQRRLISGLAHHLGTALELRSLRRQLSTAEASQAATKNFFWG